MKDLGLSLSTGINSFAKGMEMGERWKSRMDDDAWNAEVKNRQRAEWKASDDLRAKQAQAQQLQAAYEAIQSGIDIDPAPLIESMRNAGQFGASVAQHFAEPEKMQGWLQAADQVFQTGQGSPEALEALNWRLQDQINKGVGEELKQPVVLGDAHVIPAGSKIVGKRISTVVPSRSKNGLYFGLDVEVETPDGKRMTYPAPVTVGRDSNPDAQIMEVPLDSIFDLVEADRMVMSDVQRDPKFAGALRSMILASGGKVPEAPKREEFKREIGNEIVTFQRMPDGTEKEVARAPRWQPESPPKPTNAEREYELAKREGFKGSYLDFVQAKKGQGLSVTLPDGTVVQQGGAPVKLTEGQSKDLVYHTRAMSAIEPLNEFEGALTNLTQSLTSGIPVVGNYTVSPEFQQAEQAGREFLASILRKDTGAAVTKQEFDLYGKTFLPRPGDSAAVLAQKRNARAVAVDAIRSGLGSAEILAKGERLLAQGQREQTGGAPLRDATPNPSAAQRVPAVGAVEGGYRFKGGNPADPQSWEPVQ